jgi:outer membrane receptor for ferrienterochelin and colicins
VAGTWWGGQRVTVRGSVVGQQNDRTFAGRPEQDSRSSAFAEAAMAGMARGRAWVAGAAVQHERYRHRDVSGVDETTLTPGLFLQQEWSPADWLTVSASGRTDLPTDHGLLFSPRVAVLLRPAAWSVRLSAGAGHHLPGYWIEEVEAIGLGNVAREPLDVERATSLSIDVGREIDDVAVNLTGFSSRITDAVALRGAGTAAARIANVPGITRTHGAELLLNAELDPIHAIATWTWLVATEPDPDGAGRREVPLTPRHAAGLVLMWELAEEAGRTGLEIYYTGEQPLHDNPYRERSRPYVLVGVLAERRLGPARLFVNFENIGGIRQTRWDPLLLPQRAADGRRTTDAWAPLDGRVINGGVRLSF